MGIRFCCPNGHKLNVKAEFAGKVGVCPKCRIKTTIPMESVFNNDEFRRLKEPETSTSESKDIVGNERRSERAGATNSDERGAASNEELNRLMRDAVGETSRKDRVDDLRDEADDSNDRLKDENVDWFVQTSDKRSYGPAPSSVLKTWIEEMRISPTTLVWREGWESWEEAGAVFSQVRRLFAAKDFEPNGAADPKGGARRDAAGSAFASLAEAAKLSGAARRYVDDEKRASRRQKKARRTFGLVVSLVATVLALTGVLIFALCNR